MTEYLIRLLKDEYRVAVLSRGYKRASKGFYLADDTTSVEDLGDEPFQYHQKFSGIHIAVDTNRNNGVKRLLQLKNPPDVIVLDDAFQHRKIKAGFNILLTSYTNLYVDDLLFPAGNLRDARREARRAQVIIVTKCPEYLSREEQQKIKKKLKLRPDQQLFFTGIYYEKTLKPAKNKLYVKDLLSRNFTLVTGIANSKPLVQFLKGKNLDFEHLNYPDHHQFSDKEISVLKQKECIITTEKDYMRLQHQLSKLYYLPIKTTFLNEETAFHTLIREFVENNNNSIIE